MRICERVMIMTCIVNDDVDFDMIINLTIFPYAGDDYDDDIPVFLL